MPLVEAGIINVDVVFIAGFQGTIKVVNALHSKDTKPFTLVVTPKVEEMPVRNCYFSKDVVKNPFGTHPTFIIIAG